MCRHYYFVEAVEGEGAQRVRGGGRMKCKETGHNRAKDMWYHSVKDVTSLQNTKHVLLSEYTQSDRLTHLYQIHISLRSIPICKRLLGAASVTVIQLCLQDSRKLLCPLFVSSA